MGRLRRTQVCAGLGLAAWVFGSLALTWLTMSIKLAPGLSTLLGVFTVFTIAITGAIYLHLSRRRLSPDDY